MTPSNRSTPTRRDGITLTLTLVTEPPHLAESLALALKPTDDQTITMNLTAVVSEVIARYISMIEETPCKAHITDIKANLP